MWKTLKTRQKSNQPAEMAHTVRCVGLSLHNTISKMKKRLYVAAFTEGHQLKDCNPATPESPWAYFHGQLYHDLGCDIEGHDQVDLKYCPPEYCKVFDLEDGPVLMMNVTGCIPVNVHGVEKPCIGFFWPVHVHTNYYVERGLICYADDTEAIMFARNKLAKRARVL